MVRKISDVTMDVTLLLPSIYVIYLWQLWSLSMVDTTNQNHLRCNL